MGCSGGWDCQQFDGPLHACDMGKVALHEHKLCVSVGRHLPRKPQACPESAAHKVDLAECALVMRPDLDIAGTPLRKLECVLPADFPLLRQADAVALGPAHG